jgi:acetyl esterase/lipase
MPRRWGAGPDELAHFRCQRNIMDVMRDLDWQASDKLDVRTLLDPEVETALGAFPVSLGTLSLDTLAELRRRYSPASPREPSPVVMHHDVVVDNASGLRVRIHRKRADVPDDAATPGGQPCVVWMHGGGYVMGGVLSDDARFDRWCEAFDCVGVSIDYRLAPEFSYPAPLDDCLAGLRWVRENAADLGIDTARIGVGGSSAGGGLAASLALLVRDNDDPPVAFQLLIYPMIDDRLTTPSSRWDDPVWPPTANEFGWRSYLGDLEGDAVPVHAAPAREGDLRELPTTLIVVGALDGFSDANIEYAERLRHAGVSCELHVYPGAPHGFEGFAGHTAVGQRAAAVIQEWLGRMMGG